MFEITADDIAALNDEDLRSLIGRLCEAEMRRRGLPTSAVTWGGDQNAADGGLDVRVKLSKKAAIVGFVPRPLTGFQVKKPDMPPAKIAGEMKPRGKVRRVIRDLAERSGAYIIVSSKASVSDSALEKRRAAMRATVKGLRKGKSLTVDFYDRSRVATWVRDHPGLIPWARERLGKPIRGWHSYGAWAYPAEGDNAPYLLDDKLRVFTGSKKSGSGITAVEGLKLIRDALREPRKVARIVGLSGVGKTRLVQALFDSRVGNDSLDPSLAIYTNLADDPDPQPVLLASDLMASKTRAILVIDNCPPELHRRLSEVCRAPESFLSVVTIEYDVRDDAPEDTDVFRLEPSSLGLIEKLLRTRFKSLSQVAAQTIAKFSDGNARVAIALAGTVGKNETIAGIADEDLFARLFRQRHEHDPSLLLIAQACSLVYSFQGEAISGEDAELPAIAAMIGKSADEVFRGVAELKTRDLVQQRGVWRAVLPHGIANRLAKMALQNIPREKVETNLINGGSERLLKSFSRRLGYLHDSDLAIRWVREWLAEGGLLSDIANLNPLGMAMFDNIAPICPEAVLAALERVPPEALTKRDTFQKIIWSIAYDPKLFERAAELLLRISAKEQPDRRTHKDRYLTALFFLYFSGTHASIEQRVRVLDRLLRSDDPYRRMVGVKCLHNLLEASHFTSGAQFDFGARPRDFGYHPKTVAEFKHWYVTALKLVESIVQTGLPVAKEAQSALASQFRGIWFQPLLRDDLERVCRQIASGGFWREGWIAVCRTLKYDYKNLKDAARKKLVKLEKALRPRDLLQNIRGMVLAQNSHGLDFDEFDFDDDDADSLDKADRIAVALGKDASHDPTIISTLLPELVAGQGRLWRFGRGLATGTDDARSLWSSLVTEFGQTPEARRNTQVLRGFLEGLMIRDPKLANELLDDALTNDALAAWFPELQTGVEIDHRGAERLLQSVRLGKAPFYRFRYVAWGKAADPVSGPDLKALLLALVPDPSGWDSAVEILHMRLFSDRQSKKPIDLALIEAGRELLKSFQFKRNDQNGDHRIEPIVKMCLSGPDGADGAKVLCMRFKKAIAARETYAFHNEHLLGGMFKVQPLATLDALFGGDTANQKLGCEIISDASHHRPNPLKSVSIVDLLAWCSSDPNKRFPLMARAISVFTGKPDQDTSIGWSDAALALIDKAPDRVAVLKPLARRLWPNQWSGSRAVAMERGLPLLETFARHSDPALAAFARAEKERLQRDIATERQRENREDRERDESFE
jgi:hypothetical protein